MTFYRAAVLLLSLVTCSLFLLADTAKPENQDSSKVLASIAGLITTRDGHPVPDAHVEAYDPLTGGVVASTYSGRNGAFVMQDVPLGSYEVQARSGFAAAHATVLLKSAGNAAASAVKLLLSREQKPFSLRAEGNATVSVDQLRRPGKLTKVIAQIRQALHDENTNLASKYVDEALRIDPDNSEAITFRALVKMRRGDNDGALDDLDRSAKTDSHLGLTYLGLGAVFNRMEQYDDAERALDRATTLDPSSWQAYMEMAKTMLGKENFARALGFADRAQALAPKDHPPLHLVRANALMGLKNFREAATELQAYVDRDHSKDTVARAKEMLQRIRTQILKPATSSSGTALISSGDHP